MDCSFSFPAFPLPRFPPDLQPLRLSRTSHDGRLQESLPELRYDLPTWGLL
jgi:hypothetical protein